MQGLVGVIEGDLQAWLDALTAQAKPGQVLEVACDNLIRLDFVAAGGLLNWAAEMQNQGYILLHAVAPAGCGVFSRDWDSGARHRAGDARLSA